MPLAVIYIGLVLARVGTFVAVFPLFATRTPRLVRVGLAVALTAYYVVGVEPRWLPMTASDVTDLRYMIALLREGMIGAVIGVMFGLFLLPARVAGEFVAQQIGLAVSSPSILGADAAHGALPQVFESMASIVFLATDAHHVVLAVLHASFAKLPLGGQVLTPPSHIVLTGLSQAHEMGLLVAAPLALCMFLLAVGMALTARAAPQLNIYSVGFTLQVIVALLGTLFLLPELVHAVTLAMEHTKDLVQHAWS